MIAPEIKSTHISQYMIEGYSKAHPNKESHEIVTDLEDEIYWLWHILWDYLSDSERLDYINSNTKPFVSMLDDLDPLIEYCSHCAKRRKDEAEYEKE